MFNLTLQNQTLTMSSYDFLNEVINPARMSAGEQPVRNRDFVARIEDELDDLGASETFARFGNSVKFYDLNMEQMTLVGMRESKAVRRIVLEKLKELSNRGVPALPNFNNPVEAARAWADQFEEKQIAYQKLEEAQPKIEFVDKYVDSTDLKGFRQVCKILKANESKFREFLLEEKIMYRLNGSLVAYQNHVDAKRFDHKTGVAGNGHAFTRALFTAKGVEWVAGQWAKFNLRNAA